MKELIDQILSKKNLFLAEINVLKEHGELDEQVEEYLFVCNWLDQLLQDVHLGEIPQPFLEILAKKIVETPEYIIKDGNGTTQLSQKFFEEKDMALHNIFMARYSYNMWKQLEFLKENIVLIGANGSGKSTLAQLIQSILPSKNGIVINAQKYLIIPTLNSIPSYSRVQRKLDEFQKR